MAKEKITFDVKGKVLTAHEKAVYDKVNEMGVVDYNDIANACEISTRSAIATLARLEKTHGLLVKNEPVKATSYEIAE